MSSLLVVNATLKRVRRYNPDLDIDVLWFDEQEVNDRGLHWDVAHVRSALVARISDIVKQSSLQSALDTAVAMAEVLVCSYAAGPQAANGHKYAIQAISLLAMCEERFDAAVDLFFDLVDRFCARLRDLRNNTDMLSSMRTLQNYDQTFVKIFLSKQWRVQSTFNLDNPLERIKSIRRDNGPKENRAMACVRTLSGTRTSNPMFCDSVQVLKKMQRRRKADAFRWKGMSGNKNGTMRRSIETAGTSSVDSSRSREERHRSDSGVEVT